MLYAAPRQAQCTGSHGSGTGRWRGSLRAAMTVLHTCEDPTSEEILVMYTTRQDIDTDRLLSRATDFIWRNARLLERHLFAYHTAQGSADQVRAALRAYQNADGGFGNALEPDKRCPASQPIDAEMALRVLAEIGGDAEMT